MKQTQQNDDFDFDLGEFEPSQKQNFTSLERLKLERDILYLV